MKKDGNMQFPLLSTLPDEAIIRLPHVLLLLGGLPQSTFWSGVKEGRFPKPLQLTKRTIGWRVRDVRDTLNNLGGE